MHEFEIEISVKQSKTAGCVMGVRADLEGLAAPEREVSLGSSLVELVVEYAYSAKSVVELGKCVSVVTYPCLTVVEGMNTACCRVVSLLRDGVGVVVLFRGSGHPRPARQFHARVKIVE